MFVDAWTSRGGIAVSQLEPHRAATWTICATRSSPFVDGRYPTLADRDHRGLAGKSSGGYGAMVVPMLRPDVFGALASHAGDALFECCYLRDFPVVARELRDHFDGSYEVLPERLAEADHFDWARSAPFELYGYAVRLHPGSRPPRRRRCCRSTSPPGG